MDTFLYYFLIFTGAILTIAIGCGIAIFTSYVILHHVVHIDREADDIDGMAGWVFTVRGPLKRLCKQTFTIWRSPDGSYRFEDGEKFDYFCMCHHLKNWDDKVQERKCMTHFLEKLHCSKKSPV